MRRGDLDRVAGALREPVARFVQESRVRIALLLNESGQILAQHGFTGRYQMVNVAALAAGAHASARALAEITGAGRWSHMHHDGDRLQLFLAPFRTPVDELILVAIFEEDSSLGLVRLFFDRLAGEVSALPEFQQPLAAGDPETFEHDLEAGLSRALPTEPEAEN